MKSHLRWLLSAAVIGLGIAVLPVAIVSAEDETATESSDKTEKAAWKEDLSADKEKVAQQRETIKDNADAAKTEEKGLHDQIRDAAKSGDKEKAQSLKDQLKTTHQENVQQRQESVKSLHSAQKEVRSDMKQGLKANFTPRNKKDGKNVPGPKGGPGAGLGK